MLCVGADRDGDARFRRQNIGEQMPARHSKPKRQTSSHAMLVAGFGPSAAQLVSESTVPYES